jgi:hypothetical protein
MNEIFFMVFGGFKGELVAHIHWHIGGIWILSRVVSTWYAWDIVNTWIELVNLIHICFLIHLWWSSSRCNTSVVILILYSWTIHHRLIWIKKMLASLFSKFFNLWYILSVCLLNYLRFLRGVWTTLIYLPPEHANIVRSNGTTWWVLMVKLRWNIH